MSSPLLAHLDGLDDFPPQTEPETEQVSGGSGGCQPNFFRRSAACRARKFENQPPPPPPGRAPRADRRPFGRGEDERLDATQDSPSSLPVHQVDTLRSPH